MTTGRVSLPNSTQRRQPVKISKSYQNFLNHPENVKVCQKVKRKGVKQIQNGKQKQKTI